MRSYEALEERLGYVFRDKKLLRRALTHRSYACEHNERLEFLGDSVLNCVIGCDLFLRDKHFTEGVLSRVRANLVCEKMLHEIAAAVNVSEFLLLGEGEMRTGGAKRPSIMADAMEAMFGAVFLEAGFEEARRVILHVYEPILKTLTEEKLSKDPKTCLQELLQGMHHDRPVYAVIGTSGAAHARVFEAECRIDCLGIAVTGSSTSRRNAEQLAAQKALDIIKSRSSEKKGGSHE